MVGLVFLTAFRVGLNIADSNVIDVGYAGVIGADRIADGDPLYGDGFSDDVERGDTYGPVTYLAYVPFEQALPWSGRWDDLPAAHGAALAFDLIALGGLVLLGRRLRSGREGRELGLALGFAWGAYPYTAFALQTNSNDTAGGDVAVSRAAGATLPPARARDAATAVAVGAGRGGEVRPAALAPLFARGASGCEETGFARRRAAARRCRGYAAVPARRRPRGSCTTARSATRQPPSPFSIWGQVDGLGWLQTAVKIAAAALALLVAFVPVDATPSRWRLCGAAVLWRCSWARRTGSTCTWCGSRPLRS